MYYRIEAIVKSDRDEDNLGLYTEGVLEGHFDVKDLSVYEIHYHER
ncbi:hypothetical protein SEA_POCAHONTAS_59 [Mycobacterium phage Pocahontas]|uniref:Uncharacterized protein n=1 Tax=Mycobacterium phage Veracruz TaxID=2530154 RepID=A0A481VSV5_9CAUD|nr:hypothetical protein KIP27_gp34 [Mycobacterium phage Veracruz]AIS73732.1 hypothetical protein PBI_QUINNKIRO_58 [Mycobacterium phage QuinnKiro]ALA11861.1 hypothetical protein SEA_TEXAGE_58 [Mycobacterium phage Texage]AOT24207.1 hypothetical protein SEA_TODACORO_59 [Mycobacterium phage Todacoro]AWY03590.1 hypothetical protein SEA_HOOKMOUNT_59 [Mycobacterium phage Hookmount]AYR03437.1 hypothetical protein SEA_POPCICLE_59 [Mycobacterium phage Popcicle]AZV00623.1 hypothetical protein SEA_NORBER